MLTRRNNDGSNNRNPLHDKVDVVTIAGETEDGMGKQEPVRIFSPTRSYKENKDFLLNDIQEVEASIRGIHETQQPTSKANASMDLPLWCSNKELGIKNDGRNGFVKGKCRINSQEEQIKEQ